MTQRFLLLLVVPSLALTSTLQARTFLLPADALELPGAWSTDSEIGPNVGAKRFLAAGTPNVPRAPAAGAVEIPTDGKWRVWVRTKDFAKDRPGIRTFSVRLGETKLPKPFGGHGLEGDGGWAWEDGGVYDLKAGPLLVVLGEQCKTSARCESLLFTDNLGYTPEGVSWSLQKERAKVLPLAFDAGKRPAYLPTDLGQVAAEPSATLANDGLRVTFHPGTGGVGVKVATRAGNGWEELSTDAGAASYRVVSRPIEKEPKVAGWNIYPSWDLEMAPEVEVAAGAGKAKTRQGPATAPWVSGDSHALRPVSVKQRDATTVDLEFAPLPEGKLTGTWTLESGKSAVRVKMTFHPAKPGFYSLGFHGPLEVAPAEADSWLLPFQFQGNRFPAEPSLILSGATPTPMTLVARGGMTCSLVADPDQIPYEWPRAANSGYAFGLRNEAGKAQPLLYSPVLGLQGSRSEGGTVESTFSLRVGKGDWYAAYREVVDDVIGLKDYRRPTTFSLTDTAFNLMDLMRNETAAGWDPKAKGSVQIESQNVVSQASPLTYMSLYLLTGDADFYERFARPSLEFLLSRPITHFAFEKEIGDRYYTHQPMDGPVRTYGAGVYASALAMTGGRTAAFGELCLTPDGTMRRTAGGHVQAFDDTVMLYRLTGDSRWLVESVAAADKYIAALAADRKLYEPGDHAFANNTYVPNWEGLLHVYEISGEKRFLDASEKAARMLLTTLWTQPRVPVGNTTLNPGGVYDNARGLWWWGNIRKRLGVWEGPDNQRPQTTPAPAIPERVVPAWVPSNVGLGLEHPFTYVRRGGYANILMSTWAPNFLRVAKASGDPAFRVAARNSMIGRFANYPGYYLDGPTDEFRRADYPVKGPDITSLYLHHIPPFAASVVDFLFTDIETRSDGKIAFPWVRQFGYVWFDSRLWGHAPGEVYGEKAWPWLHRTAARPDNPAVDHLLAHGGGKFHVILANQSPERETVRVSFDEKALGRPVEGATLVSRVNGKPGDPVKVQNGVAEIAVPAAGLVVLTLDGVKIDVPTQRAAPAPHVTLPTSPARTKAPLAGTKWQAIATVIDAPPFAARDLHAYVNAGREDLASATLHYRAGTGPEMTVEATSFPFEFSVKLADPAAPVEWTVEARLPDGSVKKTAAQTIPPL